MNTDPEQLRYPIGKHSYKPPLSPRQLAKCLDDIGHLPEKLSTEIIYLSPTQLDTPYRPEGWTIRQLLYHLSDSHMNAYIRFKMALTEDRPLIKPYDESAWAALNDTLTGPIDLGVELITALHKRWMLLLRSLGPAEMERSYFHPEMGKQFTLQEAISLYAWHSNHHLAHITELKKRNHWK